MVLAHGGPFEISHVEPPNWWVGMHNPRVQIMLHGERVSELTPTLQYAGVTIEGIERTANPNYLFVNVRIRPSTRPGTLQLNLKHGGKTVATVPYALQARRPDSAQRRGFDARDSVYLIVPDRFANGDPSNDQHAGLGDRTDRTEPTARHGGDIAGMAQHLDYIQGLGFTMIWPTPLLENKQPAYSYHGYALTDYYRMDPRFGSNEDYRNFVQAAKQRGIGVIQDIVVNHIGSGHWWMKDLPAPDWVNYATGAYVPTNNRHITVQDPYAAKADRKLFLEGWFDTAMPDLNQRNSLLARYLIQNTVWWIEYADLAGIREDTYPYADTAFLKQWSDAVLAEYPRLNIVGEEMHINPSVLAYWQKGHQNRDGYASGLPMLMDFPVSDAMPSVLMDADGWDTGWGKLYELIATDFVYPNPMNLMVFPDNHDRSRIFSVLREDVDLLKTLVLFNATTRGMPQFFYGTEILAKSPVVRNDGLLRSDFPGGWAGDAVNAFTGQGLSGDQRAMQQFFKKLLNWRKSSSAVTAGRLTHFIPDGCTYAYFRHDAAQRVMVVLNKCQQDSELNLSRFAEVLGTATRGKNVLTDQSVDLSRPLALKAKQSVLLEVLGL